MFGIGVKKSILYNRKDGVPVDWFLNLLPEMRKGFKGPFRGEHIDKPCGYGSAGVELHFIIDFYLIAVQWDNGPPFDGDGHADNALLFRDKIGYFIGVDG